jgi:intracellular sulfur oxidation DsrE/DsrF family protein
MSRTVLTVSLLALGGLLAISAPQSRKMEERKLHRVVFEVTAEAATQWEAVLNNVENLQKAFAPEPAEVEVVVHGKGLSMLRKTNTAQAGRLATIAASGVKFAACENTMRRMNVHKSDLFDFAVTVDSGVAEVVRKQEAGWAYVKGGG